MITQILVEKALQRTQAAQASLRQSQTVDVKFQNNRLKSSQSWQKTVLAVKIFQDSRVGFSTTTDLHDLDGVLARTQEAAIFGSPASYILPGFQAASPVKVFDSDLAQMGKTDLVMAGQETVEAVTAYNPDVLVDDYLYRQVEEVEFTNSSGASYTYESTRFGSQVSAQMVRGTDILTTGHSLRWRQRTPAYRDLSTAVIEQLRWAECSARIRSGSLPVIFTPCGTKALLIALYLGFSGKEVVKCSSPLAGKLGVKIATDTFTLVDNPLIDYADCSAPYDGEGVACGALPLIEKGIVRNFLYDLDSAHKAGAQPNGHGPDCSPTNLVISAGDTSFEQLLKNIGEGLLVQDMIGLGQGNFISGEFSGNVVLGYKIEKGEIVGRVKDLLLSGISYAAIQHISAIGDRQQWVNAAWENSLVYSPYILVEGLNVVAR